MAWHCVLLLGNTTAARTVQQATAASAMLLCFRGQSGCFVAPLCASLSLEHPQHPPNTTPPRKAWKAWKGRPRRRPTNDTAVGDAMQVIRNKPSIVSRATAYLVLLTRHRVPTVQCDKVLLLLLSSLLSLVGPTLSAETQMLVRDIWASESQRPRPSLKRPAGSTSLITRKPSSRFLSFQSIPS